MNSRKPLTIADLPKDYLVKMLEPLMKPVPEENIARAIIQHQMERAEKHWNEFKSLLDEIKKTRSKKKRKALHKKTAQHTQRCESLVESSKALARQFGLQKEIFQEE